MARAFRKITEKMNSKLLILTIAIFLIVSSIVNAVVEDEFDFSKLNSTNLYKINWTSTTAEVDLYLNMTYVGYNQFCRHENEPVIPSMWTLASGAGITSDYTFDEYTNAIKVIQTSPASTARCTSAGKGVFTAFIVNEEIDGGSAAQYYMGQTDDLTFTHSVGFKGDSNFIRHEAGNTKIRIADDNRTFIYAMIDSTRQIEYARNFSGTGGEAGESQQSAKGSQTPTIWEFNSNANSGQLVAFRTRGWLSTASKNLSLNVFEYYPNMTTEGSAFIVNVTAGRGDEVRVNISCDNRVTWTYGSVNTTITCSAGSTNKPIVRLQHNNTDGAGNITKIQISPGVVADTTPPAVNITNFNVTTKKNDRLNISCQSFDTATIGNITFNLTGNVDLYNFSFSLSGASANYSQNITMNLTRNNVVNSTCWAADSTGNLAQNSTLVTIADTIPTFTLANNNTNARINESDQISALVNDADFLSMIIASWNGSSTGAWINISNITLDSSISIANNYSVNVSVLLTRGNTIGWLFYANDSVVSTFTASSLNTFIVGDTLGSIAQGINATAIRINSVVNISGNITDIDGDTAFGMIAHNQSGAMVNTTFIGLGQGTRFNFSQAITITLSRGNVINFTTFYNDTVGTQVQGTSNKFTVDDTPITFGSFTNTSDLTYNKNQTINWSCSDADTPSDSITSNAYFEAINPPTVRIATNITDFNITTNMTTDGKYFLNVTCNSSDVIAYSTIFNITLDVTTPTIAGLPVNATFYRSSTNISLTLTDNIQLFEGNISLYSLSGVLLNTTNKTNISATSYILNLSLNVSEMQDGQYNLSAWVGDTKNANKKMPSSVTVGKDKTDKTKQRNNIYIFNDTATGLQINISVLINSTKLGQPKDNQNLEINVTLINNDYFKLTIAYDADEDNQTTFLNFTSNQEIIRAYDEFATHLLFGTGKNRLSYDSDDAVEEFNMEVMEGTESYVISYIPKNTILKGERLTIDPRQDNLNILENSAIIEFDTGNPQFFSLNVSRNGLRLNNTFFNNATLNFSSNTSDKNNHSLLFYANSVKNITSGYRSNETINSTITFLDGNYTILVEINDSAGNKINSTFLNIVVDTIAPVFSTAINRTTSNSTDILPTTDVNLSVFGFGDIYAINGNFSYNISNGTWYNISSFNQGNGTYHVVINKNNLTEGAVIGWKFYAYDLAGNELDPIYTFKVGTLATASTTPKGGGSSGGSFNLDQLECNQRAKQQNRCLTYNPDSKSCESGCPSSYACNEDFVCQGAFLQPDYIPLANLLVPNLQEEQCFKQGYSFFQDSCYNCNGKLANLKGTIVCLQCKEGFRLNDNNVCIQTLLQRTQTTLNPIDKLARKISPNNPFLGFLIMVGVGGMLIYAYSNRTIIKTKFRRY